MAQWIWLFLILSFGLLWSACGTTAGRGRSVSRSAEQRFASDRAEIIERLVPEDGRTRRVKLLTISEAITKVSNVPNRDIPEDAFGIRRVLRERSLQDLRRIEAIVLEAEKKREDSRSE